LEQLIGQFLFNKNDDGKADAATPLKGAIK
jgi:hypothetical protein